MGRLSPYANLRKRIVLLGRHELVFMECGNGDFNPIQKMIVNLNQEHHPKRFRSIRSDSGIYIVRTD